MHAPVILHKYGVPVAIHTPEGIAHKLFALIGIPEQEVFQRRRALNSLLKK